MSSRSTPHGIEPLTSLLIRETTIAAAAAGKLSRALWQISRVLREHLQPDVECAKTAVNKGRSGAESDGAAGLPVFSDPFQADLFEGVDVKPREHDPRDPKNTAPVK